MIKILTIFLKKSDFNITLIYLHFFILFIIMTTIRNVLKKGYSFIQIKNVVVFKSITKYCDISIKRFSIYKITICFKLKHNKY